MTKKWVAGMTKKWVAGMTKKWVAGMTNIWALWDRHAWRYVKDDYQQADIQATKKTASLGD
jgi:hypothetical protein